MKLFANDAVSRAADTRHVHMKNVRFSSITGVVLVTLLAGGWLARVAAAETEGVALAVIYDTSGSMRENVNDEHGKPTPKYVIANRALIAISKQIQGFIT